MRRSRFYAIASIIFAVVLHGCGGLRTAQARKDYSPKAQVTYSDAFDKAVKACRDSDLTLGVLNKDAGQVNCISSFSLFSTYYNLDIYIEKEKDMVKSVDVKASGNAVYVPPSDSGAEEIVGKYLNALRRLGVE